MAKKVKKTPQEKACEPVYQAISCLRAMIEEAGKYSISELRGALQGIEDQFCDFELRQAEHAKEHDEPEARSRLWITEEMDAYLVEASEHEDAETRIETSRRERLRDFASWITSLYGDSDCDAEEDHERGDHDAFPQPKSCPLCAEDAEQEGDL